MTKTLKSRGVEQLVRKLEIEGNRILHECEQEHTYKHRTDNLYDSYGYGIYVGGKIRKSGFLTPNQRAREDREWHGQAVSGREQILNFLNNEYKPTSGIDMVVVAAMPYAEELETKYKYRVIAMSYDKLRELQARIPGSKVVNIFQGKKKGGES